MKREEISLGQVVMLNAGGKAMTVTYLGQEDEDMNVVCSWHNALTDLVQRGFAPEALRPWEPENTPARGLAAHMECVTQAQETAIAFCAAYASENFRPAYASDAELSESLINAARAWFGLNAESGNRIRERAKCLFETPASEGGVK